MLNTKLSNIKNKNKVILLLIFSFLSFSFNLYSQAIYKPFRLNEINRNLKQIVNYTILNPDTEDIPTETNPTLFDNLNEIRNYEYATSPVKLNIFANPNTEFPCVSEYKINGVFTSKIKIGNQNYILGKENLDPNNLFKFDLEYKLIFNGYSFGSAISPIQKFEFKLKLNSNTSSFIVEDLKVVEQNSFKFGEANNEVNEVWLESIEITRLNKSTSFNLNDIVFEFELDIEETHVPNLNQSELNTIWRDNSNNYLEEKNNTDFNALDGSFDLSNDVFIWSTVEKTIDCYFKPNSFQVQILRLYNLNELYKNENKKCYAVVNWDNAITLNVPIIKNQANAFYTLDNYLPIEGTGYYIYRVRAVFDYFEGGLNNSLNYGKWNSVYIYNSSSTPEYSRKENCEYKNGDIIDIDPTNGKANHTAIFIEFNEEKNWQYNRSFSNDKNNNSLLHDNMSYFNNKLNLEQNLTKSISSDLIITNDIIYDNFGRNIANTLPIPIQSDIELDGYISNTSMKYRKNLTINNNGSSNELFYPILNITNANPFDKILDLGRVNDFYDGDKTYNSLDYSLKIGDNYSIPDAQDKAYSHNVFSDDGLNRIELSSQPGSFHKLTSPNVAQTEHAIEYFYGKATEAELVSIFGAEAPNSNSVTKDVVLDSKSNKISYSYKDFQGKVLATAIHAPDGYTVTSGLESESEYGNLFDKDITYVYNEQKISGLNFNLNDHVNFPTNTTPSINYKATIPTLQISYCDEIDNEIMTSLTAANYNTNLLIWNATSDNDILSIIPNFTFNNIFNRINNYNYNYPEPQFLNNLSNGTSTYYPSEVVYNAIENSNTNNLFGKYRFYTNIKVNDKNQFLPIKTGIKNYFSDNFFNNNPKFKINNVIGLIDAVKIKLFEGTFAFDFFETEFVDKLTATTTDTYKKTASPNPIQVWSVDNKNTINNKTDDEIVLDLGECIQEFRMPVLDCTVCDIEKYKITDPNNNNIQIYDYSGYILNKLMKKYSGQKIYGIHDNYINLQGNSYNYKIYNFMYQYTDYFDYNFPNYEYFNELGFSEKKKYFDMFFVQYGLPLDLNISGNVKEATINLTYSVYDGFNTLVNNLINYQINGNNVFNQDKQRICIALEQFTEQLLNASITNIPNKYIGEKDPEFKEKNKKLYLNKTINTLDMFLEYLGKGYNGANLGGNGAIAYQNEPQKYIDNAHLYFKMYSTDYEKYFNDQKSVPINLAKPANTVIDRFGVFNYLDYTIDLSKVGVCEDISRRNQKQWESYYKEYNSKFLTKEKASKLQNLFNDTENKNEKGEEFINSDVYNEYTEYIKQNKHVMKFDKEKEKLKILEILAKINGTCANKKTVFESTLANYLYTKGYYVQNKPKYDLVNFLSESQFNRLVDILVTDCEKFVNVIKNDEYMTKLENGQSTTGLEPLLPINTDATTNSRRNEYINALVKNKPIHITGIELYLQNISQKFVLTSDRVYPNANANCLFTANYEKNISEDKYVRAYRDIVEEINDNIWTYMASLSNVPAIRHNINDRLEFMEIVRITLEQKLVQYDFFTNIMSYKLDVNNTPNIDTKYLNSSNHEFRLYEIMKKENWYNKYTPKLTNSSVKSEPAGSYSPYNKFQTHTYYNDYEYYFGDFETTKQNKLYYKSALPAFLLSDFKNPYGYLKYEELNKERYDYEWSNIGNNQTIKFSKNTPIVTYTLLPNNLYTNKNTNVLHNNAGEIVKGFKLTLNVNQTYIKKHQKVVGHQYHFIDNIYNVTDYANIDIAYLTLNENALSSCDDLTNANSEIKNADLSTSTVPNCKIEYEFIEPVHHEFPFDKTMYAYCALDYFDRFKENLIKHLKRDEESKLAVVDSKINEYYEELPKKLKQELKVTHNAKLTYFTLYYYDRAGNLIKTVPPKGVKFVDNRDVLPPHTHYTEYQYDGRGLLLNSKSADENYTNRFWYNRAGQLRYSQTAKQLQEGKISYNLYDIFGRLVENGELKFGLSSFITPPPIHGGPILVPGLKTTLTPTEITNVDRLINRMLFNSTTNVHLIDNNNFPRIGSDLTYIGADPTYNGIGVAHSFRTITNYSTLEGIPGFPGFKAIQPVRQNLRNRVNYVTRDEDGDTTTTFDQVKTYYSYDLQGNVEYVVQDLPVSTDGAFRLFGSTQYTYDVLTKKVKGIAYNYYESDSYEQSYKYDADDRLLQVYSSRYGQLQDRESEYKYYPHGPLKRIEIGEDLLQGIDYTYNINGWLKGINNTKLNITGGNVVGTFEPGRDGFGVNEYPRDAFSSVLNYHKDDFIDAAGHFSNSDLFPTSSPPFAENFDGNIALWQTNSMFINGSSISYNNFDQGFKYDKINRLKHSNSFVGTPIVDNSYKTTYTYDPNGNIKSLERFNKDINNLDQKFDELEYNYSNPLNNKLTQIEDIANPSYHTGDLETQNPNNYLYDASGNLIKDNIENMQGVVWTPDGKIKTIYKGLNGIPGSQTINYSYDAMGQRVMKLVTTAGTPPVAKQTIYSRDANGQVMAIYEREFNPNLSNNPSGNTCFDMVLIWPTMGYECDIKVCEPFVTFNAETNTLEFSDVYNIECSDPYNNKIYYSIPEGTIIPIAPVITEYKGEYHQINRSNSWKAKYDLDILVYDAGNNPVTLKLQQLSSSLTYADPNMLPKLAEWHVYGNEQQGRFLTKFPEVEPTYYGVDVSLDVQNNIFSRQLGKKAYELKDHLGNVRTTFSDIKIPTGTSSQPFRVDLLSRSEYYPYGMKINDLSYNATGARYGYNSQEQSTELNLDGNHTTAEFWEYDARSARRWNLDPVDQISKSNYATFANNPVAYNDLNGDNPDLKFDSPNSPFGIGFKGMSKQDKKRFSDARDKAIEYGFYGIVATYVIFEAAPVITTASAPLIYRVVTSPTGNRILNMLYKNGDKSVGTVAGIIDPNPLADYPGYGDDVIRVGKTIINNIGEFGSAKLLKNHFKKHVLDFDEFGGLYKTKEEYLEGAQNFFRQESDDIVEYTRKGENTNQIVRYNKATNEFGVIQEDGRINTFFKPKEGLQYFKNEIKKDEELNRLVNSIEE